MSQASRPRGMTLIEVMMDIVAIAVLLALITMTTRAGDRLPLFAKQLPVDMNS